MVHYGFEWDEAKAQSNERKHGVSFDEAATCFLDVFGIESIDTEHSIGEERFVLMGMSDRDEEQAR